MKMSRRDAVKLFAGSIPAYYVSRTLALAAGEGQSAAATTAPAAATAPSIGLKDAYKGKFMMGTAADLPQGFNDTELANVIANYDIVTPENCMKPQGTQPSEGNFSFQRPDALVEWCEKNKIKVWGHTLCWHSQTPQFFFQGTREDALARLQKHIETVVGHLKGRLVGWDVVNESIADGNNDGTTEHLRTNSWYQVVGPDVLNKAFEWAHKTDPSALLFYNDYNIEQGAVKNTGKHASSMLLLKRLIDQGAPINGVGIQGHWHLDTNLEDVDKAIENYKSLGLKVGISELDITATGTNSGAFNAGGGGGGNRRGRGRGQTTDPNVVPGAMAPSTQNGRFSLAGFGGGAPNAGGDTGIAGALAAAEVPAVVLAAASAVLAAAASEAVEVAVLLHLMKYSSSKLIYTQNCSKSS